MTKPATPIGILITVALLALYGIYCLWIAFSEQSWFPALMGSVALVACVGAAMLKAWSRYLVYLLTVVVLGLWSYSVYTAAIVGVFGLYSTAQIVRQLAPGVTLIILSGLCNYFVFRQFRAPKPQARMADRDAFSRFEYDGWQRVADKYDSAWSGLTRLYIPALLEATQVSSGTHMLDVACGPGYVAEAARDLGARCVGVDFSPEMIRLAKSRNADIEFVTGDAQDLAFEDETFDAVVMNFGVLHLARPDAAFSEARRVLRPGGCFAFTVWGSAEHSAGIRIFEEAYKAHADPDVELPSGPAYFGYGEAEACRKTLANSGFDPATLVFRTVTADWQVPSAAFVFEAERDAGVRVAALLAAQSLPVQKAIQAQVENELRPFASENGLRIPYAAHVIAIRRPPG